jgi:hypothetical protein
LDRAKKLLRLEWAIGFWIFWESSKRLTLKVKVLLKWFYAIVVRNNKKQIPFLGVEPVQHSVFNKLHIYKEMAICTTAFLPHDNDISNGGIAFKVSTCFGI